MQQSKQFFIGIDVSKLWFDASLMAVSNHVKQAIQSQQFSNNIDGIKAFDKWLKLACVAFNENSIVVIENTGIYHRQLWSYCSNNNLPLHIGNAAHIKWSFGIARGKSDKIDSVRLCQYAYKEADSLKAMPALDSEILLLKDLMTSRSKLLTQVNAIKTYIKELKTISDKTVKIVMEKAHKDAITGLQKSITIIEGQIRKIVEERKEIKSNYELLKSVPGIGHLTAIYLICCTANFNGNISGKQLACYAGVVPFEYSSGSSIKGRNRVHQMANKDLKKMLHLCAMSAIQHNSELKQYYQRKQQEGKNKMSIINAVRNKIALRAVAVVKNKRAYVDISPIAA